MSSDADDLSEAISTAKRTLAQLRRDRLKALAHRKVIENHLALMDECEANLVANLEDHGVLMVSDGDGKLVPVEPGAMN